MEFAVWFAKVSKLKNYRPREPLGIGTGNPDRIVKLLHSPIMEERRAVFTQLDETSPVLLVVFSGKRENPKAPGFNLQWLTRDLPVKKVYVRDVNNLYYHGQHPGVGAGPDDLATYLSAIMRRQEVRRVVMAGGSMGGYAAILFGSLCGADRVLATGPQSFIDKWNRLRYWDTRDMHTKNSVLACSSANPKYFDLRTVLACTEKRPEVHFHLGRKNRRDRGHARHLWGFPEIKFIYHDTHRHDISPWLKRDGKLLPLIEDHLRFGTTEARDKVSTR